MNVDLIAKKTNVPDGLREAQRLAQSLLDDDQRQNKDLYATAK